MNTSEMQAGREMDRSVCEALGIPGRVEYYAGTRRGAGSFFSASRREVEEFIADYQRRLPGSEPARSEVFDVTHYPRVSEEMGAAWEVVEAMRDRGWYATVEDGLSYPRAKVRTWECRFVREHDRYAAEADMPALAICRAALLALESR